MNGIIDPRRGAALPDGCRTASARPQRWARVLDQTGGRPPQNADAALQAHRLLIAAVVGARHHEALQAEQILRLQGPVFLFAAALCPGDAQKHNRPEL